MYNRMLIKFYPHFQLFQPLRYGALILFYHNLKTHYYPNAFFHDRILKQNLKFP